MKHPGSPSGEAKPAKPSERPPGSVDMMYSAAEIGSRVSTLAGNV